VLKEKKGSWEGELGRKGKDCQLLKKKNVPKQAKKGSYITESLPYVDLEIWAGGRRGSERNTSEQA